MVVIALGLSVALPRLPDVAGGRAQRSIHRVALLVGAVRERAVSLRRHYRLEFDMARSAVSASYFGPQGLYVPDEDVPEIVLAGGTALLDVVTPDAGKVVDGTAFVHLSPKGFVEPAMIHLRTPRADVVTIAPGILGLDVRVLDGRVELSAP